jgi:hypothetical protein
MPFAFIIVGLVMVTSGALGTSGQLTKLLKGDLTGQSSFVYWIVSILLIGALGYVDDFKALSRSFLALIIIVLLISEDNKGSGGFFAEFQQALQSVTTSSGLGGSVSTPVNSATASNAASAFAANNATQNDLVNQANKLSTDSGGFDVGPL